MFILLRRIEFFGHGSSSSKQNARCVCEFLRRNEPNAFCRTVSTNLLSARFAYLLTHLIVRFVSVFEEERLVALMFGECR
jgi:hypothetical protein